MVVGRINGAKTGMQNSFLEAKQGLALKLPQSQSHPAFIDAAAPIAPDFRLIPDPHPEDGAALS